MVHARAFHRYKMTVSRVDKLQALSLALALSIIPFHRMHARPDQLYFLVTAANAKLDRFQA